MSWAVRPATPADAPLLGEHRGLVWREAGRRPAAEVNAQIAVWSSWTADAMTDGNYAAWIADDASGEAIGSAGLLLRLTMPRPEFPVDRDGRVHAVYVVPSMRRRGVASALMAEIIAYAREVMLTQLVLHPSVDGRPLYAGLGFVPLDEMVLRFSPPAP